MWASRAFKKNSLVTEYCGRIIGRAEAESLRREGCHSHVRCLCMQWLYIDGVKQPQRGLGGASFASDGLHARLNNATFVQR